MHHLARLQALFAAGAMALILSVSAAAETASPLAAVERDILKAYPGVAVMQTAELADLQKSRRSILLLDARTPAEYAVSRLAGARHVDPLMSAAEFQRSFGGEVRGKKVVVYCAVGGRSSDLASRIGKVAEAAGATGVYSLQGGIFRWHNEKRPLVGAAGPTDEVHPFSSNAARLIERPDGIAYTPGTSKLVQSP